MSRAVPLLALLLLAPLATAASEPLAGEIRTAEAHVTGALDVESADALLDLSGIARAGRPVRLSWEEAEGYQVERRWLSSAVFHGEEDGSRKNTTLAHGAAQLAIDTCLAPCRVFLLAAHEGRVTLAGEADDALARTTDTAYFFAGASNKGTADVFQQEYAPGVLAFGATGHGGTPLARTAARAEGSLVLVLQNVSATIRGPDGETEIDTRQRIEPRYAAGVPVNTVTDRFVLLHLQGAALALDQADGAALFTRDARARLAGDLRAPDAQGWLKLGYEQRPLAGEDVAVTGALTLQLATAADGDLLGPSPAAWVLPLEGDAERVRIEGQTWAPAWSAGESAAAAGTTLAALLLAAWAWLHRLGYAPLYTRITRTRVLSNPNRTRIFDAIVASPGINASSLSERLALSRTVVQHHLRMLESHRMVVRRGQGRAWLYYPTEEAPDADEHRIAAALREEARLRVARTLVAAPAGLTQKDISERTGLSRRLVAYHLQHLEEIQVVATAGHHPRVYMPAPRLSERLGRASGAEPAPPLASEGRAA